MTATRQDIEQWFDSGVELRYEFMIVVCDGFDYDDYPVYVNADNYHSRYREFNGVNMQRVMEVYNLSMDKETQMKEHRAFHPPGESDA